MPNPTPTYTDSFGNRTLRNGKRPENMETGPRIAEKYQTLKLENALVWAAYCVPSSLFVPFC